VAIRVGINGFGRIGRQVLKAVGEYYPETIEVVAVNDLFDAETNAHLLKYDSNYGRFPGQVEVKGGNLIVNGQEIKVFAERDPAKLPWGDLGVDIVIESTGRFTDRDSAAKHLDAGARKVIISAPAKKEDVTIVLGVNESAYDPAKHHVISNASCTTNCLAPMAKVVHDKWGIVEGLMTTVHATTATQKTVDGPSKKDWRGGRAAGINIIPSTTGAAKAVGLVLPELNGKLDGVAIRVPTPNVSVVDLTFIAARETSVDEINAAIRQAADGELKGILGYTDEPLVSADFNHDSHSSVFHMDQTKVMEGTMCRILTWYDNEWGFSNRMSDTAVAMGKLI